MNYLRNFFEVLCEHPICSILVALFVDAMFVNFCKVLVKLFGKDK